MKRGDRVRVGLEGTVESFGGDGFSLRLHDVAGGAWIIPVPPFAPVELLEPAGPEWQPGDVVAVDYVGSTEVYALTPDGWRNLGVRGGRPFDYLYVGTYPWRLLVRGGEPVQP